MAQPLLVTVRLSGDATTDLLVDTMATARVGAIAARLADALELEQVPNATIAVSKQQEVLDPNLTLEEAPIRSGDLIEVVSADQARGRRSAPAAILEVVDGPLRGLNVPVSTGQWILGRSSKTDIVLREESISARHMRVTIADEIVVEDLGSTNGSRINDGELVTVPTVVSYDDKVMVGATGFRFRPAARGRGGSEPFIRSPRMVPAIDPVEFKVRAPPQSPAKRRIPILTSLVPVAAAVIGSLVSGNWANMGFALLGPAFYALGRFVESRWLGKATFRDQARTWREMLQTVTENVDHAQSAELKRMETLYPRVDVLTSKAAFRDPILWSRTPAHDDFLSLRVGTGDVASIHTITIDEQQADPSLLVEATEAMHQRAKLHSAPILLPVDELGVVGLTGRNPMEDANEQHSSPQLRTAQWLILQAALLHSPSDLEIAALLPTDEFERWEWLKWLPHTRVDSSLRIATGDKSLELLAAVSTTVRDRLNASKGANSDEPIPRLLLVVADEENVSRPRIASVLTHGPSVGVHTLWVGTARSNLPDGCRAIVEHTGDGFGSLELIESGTSIESIIPEGIGSPGAEVVARDIAALEDASAAEAGFYLPGIVRLHEVIGGESILDDADLALAGWSQSQALGAPVGIAEDGPFQLDLRFDGPHGLVAGTTGAGKSEFLQSLVASLAVKHPPSRINFLLVDYKGGAAFREAAELPHTVGFVTDLDEHLVQRALTALGAELARREDLLNKARAKDLSAMEAAQHPDTPPSLLIVVDEFAALAGEVPEFVDGIVDIAQRGRSLGLHLLLATQRPAGVVTSYIRANTNLRIALRVASREESVDVIDQGDAADIPRSIPGRALARIGPNELIPFQSVFVGARASVQERKDVPVGVARFRVSGIEPLVIPEADPSGESGPTDLMRIVAMLKSAHLKSGSPDPMRPWLPPLGLTYSLETLGLSESGSRLLIGLGDLPERQAQEPAVLDLTAGHVLVLGASRSGKTLILRSVAAALEMQESEPVWVYGLDSAGGALQVVEQLPSVGGIVQSDDRERVTRLLRTLRTIIDDRRKEMGATGAQDLAELRRLTSRAHPRVAVLLDGMHDFVSDYESLERGMWVDELASLMADGLATGVHFVVATDRRPGISTRFSGQLPQLLCLRLANDDDYLTLGLPRGSLTADSPPGRGFLNGMELQIAILGGLDSGEAQTQAFEDLARAATGSTASDPPNIGVLPDRLGLSAIRADADLPIIGIRDSDLGPARLEVSAGLLGIFGRRASGRTTALLAVADALRRWDSRFRTLLLTREQPPNPVFGSWTRTATETEEVAQLVVELADRADETTRFAVFLDDYTDYLDTPLDSAMAKLIPVTRESPVLVVISGDVDTVRSAFGSDVLKQVKRSRSGLLLMPDSMDGDTLGASLPRTDKQFIPGRGYAVSPRSLELIQVAVSE